MESLDELLKQVRACRACEQHLPHGPNPVLRIHPAARVLIVGQAPGTKVHNSGIPWNDASGERLRRWMGVTPELFYDTQRFAVLPVGLCYPGKTRGGDAPPRKECAPLWFDRIHAQMPNVELTLLIGRYAQQHYLALPRQEKLRDTVRRGEDFLPRYLPLVHPSPRNRRWLRHNPWFEEDTVTLLRQRLREIYPDLPDAPPLELPEKLFSL